MKFYRYEDIYYEGDYVRVHERTYDLLKETPCGYWINLGWWGFGRDGRKWVSKTSRKRFAYPTQEEAMVNFKARKQRQIVIYSARLERAKMALRTVEGDYKTNMVGRRSYLNAGA